MTKANRLDALTWLNESTPVANGDRAAWVGLVWVDAQQRWRTSSAYDGRWGAAPILLREHADVALVEIEPTCTAPHIVVLGFLGQSAEGRFAGMAIRACIRCMSIDRALGAIDLIVIEARETGVQR